VRQAAALAALLLAACPAPRATLRPPTPLPVPLEPGTHHDEFALAGVVHVVRPGETVWRIARAYGIDGADLMETNGLADARALAVGAELFVPGATRVVDVPPAGEADAGSPTAPPAAAPTPPPSPPPTSTSTQTSTSVAPAPPRRPAARDDTPLAWPLEGVLYGRYGVRAGKRHDGIDIAAPQGTPVRAAADGLVIYAGEQAGYGSIVILKHEGGLVTLYAHNSRLLVREGERARRGEPIARVGETGRTSGPHLHFEVRDGTRPKNPLLFLP
jgi:murein DD-endopeptidase MepM/ murein hydrolase activator NlpD